MKLRQALNEATGNYFDDAIEAINNSHTVDDMLQAYLDQFKVMKHSDKQEKEQQLRMLLDKFVGNDNVNMAKEFLTKLILKDKEKYFDSRY